jgi:hypothetical protein
MQYMMIIKSNAATEAEVPMDTAFERAMNDFNQKLRDAGAWVTGEGFQASNKGARLTLDNGAFSVEKGPFANPDELIAGYWVIDVASKDEAIQWAKQVPASVEGSAIANGNGEIELLQVMEFPEEMQSAEAPGPASESGAPPAGAQSLKRFIGMFKASPETEAGVMPGPEIHEAMGEAIGRYAAQGLFEGGGGLMPTSQGARVTFRGGSPVVTDGPFAETKEAIAGYAIFRAPSLDDMIESSREALQIEARWRKGPVVSEIRELY